MSLTTIWINAVNILSTWVVSSKLLAFIERKALYSFKEKTVYICEINILNDMSMVSFKKWTTTCWNANSGRSRVQCFFAAFRTYQVCSPIWLVGSSVLSFCMYKCLSKDKGRGQVKGYHDTTKHPSKLMSKSCLTIYYAYMHLGVWRIPVPWNILLQSQRPVNDHIYICRDK